MDGTAATLTSPAGNWTLSTGEQNNNWVIQIISPCDLTPGVVSTGEIVDAAGFVYRFEGDLIQQAGFNTKCLGGQGRIAVVVSNLPTGDLTFLDADYLFRLTNTGGTARSSAQRSFPRRPMRGPGHIARALVLSGAMT